jgi:prepilin-type N-terminal cleavage/methylation domain-containing protein
MVARAFTLIELLVVITIIGILAAILFPVLANSRIAAEKATDLSNIKQMALAHGMYWADSDERLVTSWTFGLPGDFTFMLQPYIQNRSIMLSPGRKVTFEALAVGCNNVNLAPGGVDNPWGEPSVWGYGYNTGHDWDDSTGLTVETDNSKQSGGNGGENVRFTYGGKSVTVQIRDRVKRGIAISDVAATSQVMMLGNTGDRIVQGMGRGDLTPLSMYPKLHQLPTACDIARLQSFPTWGASIHVAYVDGHAKVVPFDLSTLQWSIADGAGTARVRPKILAQPCMYLAKYDGGNNPGHCATGDAP